MLCIGQAYGQKTTGREYYIKGGYAHSGLIQTSSATDYYGGSTFGFGLKNFFRNDWWLQTELSFLRQSIAWQEGNTSQQLNVKTVGLPILLSYRPGDILEGHFGIRPAAVYEARIFDQENPDNANNLGKDELGSFRVSLVAGGEVNISPLAIGLRYLYDPFKLAKSSMLEGAFGSARLHTIQVYGLIVF